MPPSPPSAATGRRRSSSPSVSIVIPVRDPAGLPLILRGLPPVDEVVLVADAGSAAAAQAARPDARLVRPARPGLGNALACGIAAARGDVVVTLNGDGSTDPAEVPRFVAALVAGADVALGSRYREGGRDLTGGRLARWADLLLIWCVNVLFGTDRTDPGFGYAALWRDAAARLDLPTGDTGRDVSELGPAEDPAWLEPAAGAVWGDGPEIGPLLVVRPAARGLRVTEVASVAYPPIRRARRADRARLRHWVRVALGELRRRGHRRAAEAAGQEAAPIRPERADESPTPLILGLLRGSRIARRFPPGLPQAPGGAAPYATWRYGPTTDPEISGAAGAGSRRAGDAATRAGAGDAGRTPGDVARGRTPDRSARNADDARAVRAAGGSAWNAADAGDRRATDASAGNAGDAGFGLAAGDNAGNAGDAGFGLAAGDNAWNAGEDRASDTSAWNAGAGRAPGTSAGDAAGGPASGERTTVGHDERARLWQQADRRAGDQPIWPPARRRSGPGSDLWLRAANATPPSWRAGHPEPLGGPDTQPRPAWAAGRPAGVPEQVTPRREVGGRRRRIAGLRQQPDLRVINGEGDGQNTGRRARLRAVRKNDA